MSCVEVHPLSHQPTAAWEELKQSQQVIKIKTKIPTKPPGDRKVSCVIMSKYWMVKLFSAEGDVFLGPRLSFLGHHQTLTIQAVFVFLSRPVRKINVDETHSQVLWIPRRKFLKCVGCAAVKTERAVSSSQWAPIVHYPRIAFESGCQVANM